MGMDVCGLKPSSEAGKYFYSNVWSWIPLWKYVCKVCPDILTPRDVLLGQYNSNHKISAKKAAAIGARLKRMILSGRAQTHARRYRATRGPNHSDARTPAISNAQLVVTAVGGKKQQPRFSVKDLKAFANFSADSGGFEIS